ncbi:hypothetical protein DPMN_015260 [Dreissena polymorpha]|uniref:Uncharacterized protein n=1 Tax=Dreissena polymorpha TaxID=45954 RepID=A0A9D4NAS1_DREPO|nr:hypothetical protein DPMN_015260 [Dreissena polymorpha]
MTPARLAGPSGGSARAFAHPDPRDPGVRVRKYGPVRVTNPNENGQNASENV